MAVTQTEPAIRVTGLSKSFGGIRAVSDLDLTIAPGTIHALIGPNGAGKTTVFNLLTKFYQPTSGKILFGETDITRSSPAEVARMGMVRSFQISAVFGRLSVRENIAVALQRPKGLTFAFWKPLEVLRQFEDRIDELLLAVGLENYADTAASELPYGRKRALEIATTLALEPKMLLLDEPTSGLGHEDIDRIAELIASVRKDRTILMVEHNLSVVAKLSDWITVLTQGSVLAEGRYDEVSGDERVIEAYMGAPEDDE